MIRRAVLADMPELLDFGRAFHAAAGEKWTFSDDGFVGTIGQLIATGYVAISDDGFIAGVVVKNPLATDWVIAKEFLWWAKGSGPALLRSFRKWAIAVGADEIQYSCPPESRAATLYSRFGRPSEAVYSEYV